MQGFRDDYQASITGELSHGGGGGGGGVPCRNSGATASKEEIICTGRKMDFYQVVS